MLDARAAVSTYIVFGLITGFGCGVPILLSHDLKVAVPFLLAFVLVIAWIRMFRIVVKESMLSYNSMFGGKQQVRLNEIVSARTEMSVKSAFGPMYRLVLERSGSTNKPRIIINMKVFRREDMNQLIDILHDKMDGKARLSVFNSRSDL